MNHGALFLGCWGVCPGSAQSMQCSAVLVCLLTAKVVAVSQMSHLDCGHMWAHEMYISWGEQYISCDTESLGTDLKLCL